MTIIGNFLSELEVLENKATPGKWIAVTDLPLCAVSGPNTDVVCSESRRYRAPNSRHLGTKIKDAEFIAHSRNSLPKLIKAMRVLVEQLSLMAEGEGPNWEDYVQISNAALKQAEEIIGG